MKHKLTTQRSKKKTFDNGDQVDIIVGKYKGLSAKYLGKYGKVMCSVSIDGDNKDFRQVWLTLIKRKEQANVNEDDSSDA